MLFETLSPNAVGAVLLAVLLAAVGGEAFLKGVLGIAAWLRLPKLLVATTLAAFATSSPELTVSSIAALSGAPEIGLGDALGSNVVNISMIFGIALLFGSINVEADALRRDFSVALFVPCLTFLLAMDGQLSRTDGYIFLLVFILWIGIVLRAGWVGRPAIRVETCTDHPSKAIFYGVFGLLALIGAGRLFVSGASQIALGLGVDTFVVGTTVVAIGTSLPELVTVLLSRSRGHDEVGVGTLLGSNLFNGLAIVGVAASLHPISISLPEISIALVFGVVGLMLLLPNRAGRLSRVRGVVLLASYVGFVLLTIGIGHG